MIFTTVDAFLMSLSGQVLYNNYMILAAKAANYRTQTLKFGMTELLIPITYN